MKHKCMMMRCLAMLAFIAICSLGVAQLPGGFPKMPNTGNPSADAQAYDLAKTQWFANNPPTSSSGVLIAPVVVPTAAENAASEAQKTLAAHSVVNNTVTRLPQAPEAQTAEMQLRLLRSEFDTHINEWSTGNVRLYQAYIEVFTMARGKTVVSVPQEKYNSFFKELKALVDANTALFNITQ
jgi:hypothetical protein